MSEFKQGYIDAYSVRLRALMNTAEELSLFHTPEAFVEGSSSERHYAVDGMPIDVSDAEQNDGIAFANMTLIGLRTRIKMHLLVAAADNVSSDIGEQERERQLDDALGEIETLIDAADYTYAVFGFVDHDNDETVTVALSKIIHAEHVLINQLDITTSDGYLNKTVTVSEISVTPEQATLDVSQSFVPAHNPDMEEVARFFDQHSEPYGMQAIMQIFTHELLDKEGVSVDELYLLDKYKSNDVLANVQKTIANIKMQARHAKEGRILQQSNPEVVLPTADDLAKYATFLDKARS